MVAQLTAFGQVLKGLISLNGRTQTDACRLAKIAPAELSRWMRGKPPSTPKGREDIERLGDVLAPGAPGAKKALLFAAGFSPQPVAIELEVPQIADFDLRNRSMATKALELSGLASNRIPQLERRTAQQILEDLRSFRVKMYIGSSQDDLQTRLDLIGSDLIHLPPRQTDVAKAKIRLARERSRFHVEYWPAEDQQAYLTAHLSEELAKDANFGKSARRWLEEDAKFAKLISKRVSADAGLLPNSSHADVADQVSRLDRLTDASTEDEGEAIWLMLELAKALIGAFENKDIPSRFDEMSGRAIERAGAWARKEQTTNRTIEAHFMLSMAHETRARGLVRLPGKLDWRHAQEAQQLLALGGQIAARHGLVVTRAQIDLTLGELLLRQGPQGEQTSSIVADYFEMLLLRAPTPRQHQKIKERAVKHNLSLKDSHSLVDKEAPSDQNSF